VSDLFRSICAVLLVGSILSFGWMCRAQDHRGEVQEKQLLLKVGEFSKRWFFFSADKDVRFNDTWTLKYGKDNSKVILVCDGTPFGYIRTIDVYENFEFGFEWNFPTDENGNSGILIHTSAVGAKKSEDDKIWPKSIQVQLHRPKAGSIFKIAGAMTDNKVDVMGLSKPVSQWNSGLITCKDGTISVDINGKKVGEVTGCNPKKGTIALQSEGSVIHFRNIWVKNL